MQAPQCPHCGGDIEAVGLTREALASISELVNSFGSPRLGTSYVDAAEIARQFGVNRAWVYENAEKLEARRLGEGPRARLRFDPKAVENQLASCPMSRGSDDLQRPARKPDRGRPPKTPMGTSGSLLPIRGHPPAHNPEDQQTKENE